MEVRPADEVGSAAGGREGTDATSILKHRSARILVPDYQRRVEVSQKGAPKMEIKAVLMASLAFYSLFLLHSCFLL